MNEYMRCFILFTLTILMTEALWGWGAVGHQTVAYITLDHLNSTAKRSVQEILGPEEDLVSVSSWADYIVTLRPDTASWHYLNLDVRQPENKFDLSNACKYHDCVLDQIRKDIGILRASFVSRREKKEALKFLVHFVGDLHQPLHCADDKDRGGNEKWFRYYGSHGDSNQYTWVNLHSFWDNLLEPKINTNPRRLATRLNRETSFKNRKEWEQGGPADWAYESFLIAQKDIYSELPEGPLMEKNKWGRDLPRDYYSGKMWGIVNVQLERAGIRLALILNGLFKKP
jgi:hypothetical protein